jgi:hypothetical protein
MLHSHRVSCFSEALELHDRLLRELLGRTSGYEVKTQGDSFMVAFSWVGEALRWCLDVQEALLRAPGPPELLEHAAASEKRRPVGGRALAGCGASLVLLDNVEQIIHRRLGGIALAIELAAVRTHEHDVEFQEHRAICDHLE